MKSFRWLSLLTSLFFVCGKFLFAQQATPAMGKTELREFIKNQMIYPEQALSLGLYGKVELLCVIDADGNLIKSRSIEMTDKDLIREGKRLARGIVWNPARERNKPTEGEYILEIEFHPKKYSKWVKHRGWDRPDADWDTSMQIFSYRNLTQLAKPVLPEGATFADFIEKNIHTPDAAKRMGISGKVVLSFIVESDGSSSNFIVREYLGMGCTEEAIRVMKLLRWQPARKNEKAVRSWNSTTLWFGEGQPQYNLQPGYNPGSML